MHFVILTLDEHQIYSKVMSCIRWEREENAHPIHLRSDWYPPDITGLLASPVAADIYTHADRQPGYLIR